MKKIFMKKLFFVFFPCDTKKHIFFVIEQKITPNSTILGAIWMPEPYKTLQACASISVPKLCNFNLQYFVNFVKKTNILFSSLNT